ncbi:MAG: porin [Gammaproteobacteria bacterium]
MKKTLLALAVLGASAGVAHAQSAVVIYGNIDAGFVKQTDQTLKIGKRANNTLGFKGTEELGNGLKAIFQLEMRYEPDTGTNEQGAGGVQRPLFQGQSRVGLQGDFGTVRIGRGLSSYQESIAAFDPFHAIPSPTGFYTDLLVGGNTYSTDALGLPGNSANRFSNAVFYNSPEVAGFQVNVSVATKESNGANPIIGRGTVAAPQYAAGAQASVNPYSVSVTYKNGPAALLIGAERNAIETELYSAAASFLVTPDLKLMGTYSHQDREHTMANQWTSRAWVLGANYTLGASKILAGYGQKTQGILNNGEQKTKQFSLGYEYSLSKRTYIYTDASRKEIGDGKVNTFALGVNHAF